MNVLKEAINIVSSGLDVLVLYIFLGAVLGKKAVSTMHLSFAYLFYFAFSAAAVIFINNQFVLLIFIFAMSVAVSFLYKSRAFNKIFACIILAIMAVLSEITAGIALAVVTRQSVEILSSNIVYYIEGVLISKALLLVFVNVIKNKKMPSSSRISIKLFLPLLALPATTLFIIFVMSEYAYSLARNEAVIVVAVASVMLIVSNILVFFLFDKQVRQDEEIRMSTLSKQQLQYQTKYYKEIAEKYRLSNKTVHDTKNLLFAISISLANNEIEKAKNIINELCSNALGVIDLIKSGNEALDALINTKAQVMQALNINFKPSVFLNAKNQIEDLDLCIIVGNALDNAVEACSKIKADKPKDIFLKIMQVNDLLTIEVINSSDETVKTVDGKIASTKKDALLHGFGLQSIQEITDKYEGSLSVSQTDGVFTLKVYVVNEIA